MARTSKKTEKESPATPPPARTRTRKPASRRPPAAVVAMERDLETLREQTRQAQADLLALRESVRLLLCEVEAHRSRSQPEAPPALETKPEAPEGRNRLGVTVAPGVVVAEVVPDTPAAAAGLARGDVVAAVNGSAVFTGLELRESIRAAGTGEVSLQVIRGGTPGEFRVSLDAPGNGDDAEASNRLGIAVEPGVVIAEVLPGTPAAEAGLARGDVLAAVNSQPVLTAEQLRLALVPLSEGAEVTLGVSRQGEAREIKARLDQPTIARQ